MMSKRTIKWEKLQNPLVSVGTDGEEEDNKVMVRATPFGVEGMRFNPNFPSEKVYICHTDFDIDDDVEYEIENTPGVEILEVYSPYRMRVTIGKCFNAKKVRRLIHDRLCVDNIFMDFDEETDANIYKETNRLNKQKKPWAIFILPNGKFESILGENEKDLEDKISPYQHIRNRIGGVIISK